VLDFDAFIAPALLGAFSAKGISSSD